MQVTVTEAARRQQIVDAAIEVIAEHGYAQASFARIVAHAGLSSTRLISYHFKNKGDLDMAVLIAALGQVDELVNARLDGVTDRVEMVRVYIAAQVELLHTHREQIRVLREVAAGAPDLAVVLHEFRVGRLQRQFTQGQREGVFGGFDPAIMAGTVAAGIDAAADSDIDPDTYAHELVELFTRAIRA
ncbi:TetR/AcrR family transcriptional regulator [Actinokineospora sp. NBRC 105648]|uniref:TetR/AcrR family transcriptional regulator n=1 Tax=Actinokineospora sp. NBRC 105648 TaxID=3032206 RepID=UPI0024A134D0|nr:TetR/AcrR family transcriptional regulator [Actinokineospora sp. NBRC 105648]GLZ37416.1 TetR family transcriptional regulator [Actinokineospora sp. NBRC 105648]